MMYDFAPLFFFFFKKKSVRNGVFQTLLIVDYGLLVESAFAAQQKSKKASSKDVKP